MKRFDRAMSLGLVKLSRKLTPAVAWLLARLGDKRGQSEIAATTRARHDEIERIVRSVKP